MRRLFSTFAGGWPGIGLLLQRMLTVSLGPAVISGTVSVTRNGKGQTFTNRVSTAGLKNGLYHALVRADNIEPLSRRPMSALYYDVDLEIRAPEQTRSSLKR